MSAYKCPKCGCNIQEIEYQNSVEIVSYPTISCLRDTDKERYEKRSVSKEKPRVPFVILIMIKINIQHVQCAN